MHPIRVLVADDDAIFRDALTEVLATDRRFEVVGVATTGDEAVALAEDHQPDVVLLDVRMPSGGPEAARALARLRRADSERARTAVVAVSANTSAPTVASMVRAGAVGYLGKGRIGLALTDLVARCAAGEVVLAVPSAAEALRQLDGRGYLATAGQDGLEKLA